jgi:hypothetical protein
VREMQTVLLFKIENNAIAELASLEILIMVVKNHQDQSANRTHVVHKQSALFHLMERVCVDAQKV